GNWSVDTSSATPTSGTLPASGLVDGNVGLQVVSTDAAGNSTTATSVFTEDHTAPTAAIGLKHDAANDTGTSATDNLTSNTQPTLVGTGEPSSTVTITITPASGGAITYTATTDATGAWSLNTATATPTSGTMPAGGLVDGSVNLGVASTDAAGNTASATNSFTEDHAAPTASIGLKHDATNDTGTSATDNLTSNEKPTLVGTGEPNSTVTITVTPSAGGAITYTATADAAGAWSVNTATATPTSGTMPAAGLPDGAVSLKVVSTDAAGNSSTATSAFTEDNTAPTASIGLKHDATNDTGTSAVDNLSANGKPVLTGTGEPSSTVTITVTPSAGGAITYTTTTTAAGAWTLDLSTATPTSGTLPAAGLPDGTVSLQVVSTDTAGNSTTATSAFTEDHTAPAASIGLKHDATNDTGASAGDSITSATKPTLVGTGEPNGTVTITVTPASGTPLTYSATTDATGAWSVNTSTATPTSGTMPAAGLPDGAVSLKVVSTDAAGNTTTATGSFVEDHTLGAPTIGLKHDAADDTGTSATDNLTNNQKPILAGTAEANSTVTVTVTPSSGGAITYTATTDASGNWSVNMATATPTSGTLPASGLVDGAVTLKVVATDAAGNVSAAATSAFTEDHTAPVAAIGLKHDAANDTGTSATDGLTSNSVPVITGTGEKSSTVLVSVTDAGGHTLTYSATTDATGAWSIDLAAQTPTSGTMPRDGLTDGAVSLSMSSTDVAGNTATATGSFTIDSVDHAATPTVSASSLGRWLFNEGSGTSTTDGYNGYTGTLTNLNTSAGGTAPTWGTGHNSTAGTALNFDGRGGVVTVPAGDTAALTGTSSLSVWFKTTQTGTTIGWSSPSIIGSESAGDGNDIQWGTLNNTGRIGLDVGNSTGVYSAAAVNDGNWHDLTITRTVNANGSSTVSIYVDGALSNSGNIAADASIPTGIVTNHLTGFGYTNGWNPSTGETLTGDVYYKGALDDAHIYNHVLTADQAKAIYTVENGYETQAVANDGDAIKLVVTDTNTTALHVTGVENGMTITDGTAAHTITSTGNTQSIDLTGWNLNALQLTNVGTGSANLQFDATDTTAGGQSHDATTWISVVNGTALLGGTAGNDTLNASAQTQAMFISGGTGNDTITGGSGNDRLLGGTGNDAISGGAGNDLIVGGTGTDSLTGGGGNDVFRWEFGDHGTAGAPNVGTITDFSSAAGNKDVLDLRDLLPGANHDGTQPGNIANYLHFDLSGSDTVIHVSSSGGFSNGYVASAEDETIILKGVDLTAAGTQNDLQIIHTLLNNGQVHLG
ncbi:MAG: beta strand repeat-containing protein, partial [Vitreoscilla sp.]